MFRRKQDVDKHVTSVLSRRRDEKERQAQGFQIARLYYDVKEYAIAKRYLSGFLNVRENVSQAHQLMAEIHEALGETVEAIDSYKKALNQGGNGSSNKHLVLKICQLYCELGTDVERMKYWCDQCEKLNIKSDVLFQLKAKIVESGTVQTESDLEVMEKLLKAEIVSRPTDESLHIKLIDLYLKSGRWEQAYDRAVSSDLSTHFVGCVSWSECLLQVFQDYSSKFADAKTDQVFNQHFLHVLRNLTYLSLSTRSLDESVQNLQRFDKQLKIATSLACNTEEWLMLLKEFKGQLFYLAGLILLKRAQAGSVSWPEVCRLSGACFLASAKIDPMDPQSPWFVKSPQAHSKINNWFYQQSYDRLSHIGHMILQLSKKNVVDWTRGIRQSVMTAQGHQKVCSVLYASQDVRSLADWSYFCQAQEMTDISDTKEPITDRQMIDIDRVAAQVHLGSLPHLVWLCLQRYSYDMEVQPNYHFHIFENLQFSTKNLETGAAESLCQLDIQVFLLATVQCAASGLTNQDSLMYEDRKEQPALLPVCLSQPLCTQDQVEWWTAAYKFCTNQVRDDFSRLRRVLIRGLETLRLIGSHGVSASMIVHIAKCLDAKVDSVKRAEYGARCPLQDLVSLERRAVFYWEKARNMLQILQRNQHAPVPKNRLFKEAEDTSLHPNLIDQYLEEANFALSVAALRNGQYETALEGFQRVQSVYSKFYMAQIYKILAGKIADSEDQGEQDKKQALIFKARDHLLEVMDQLAGNKSHELNVLVSKEIDDLDVKMRDLEIASTRNNSFYTPLKTPVVSRSSANGISDGLTHSTPRAFALSQINNNGLVEEVNNSDTSITYNLKEYSPPQEIRNRPAPSPERLDFQIRSLNYSQASLFKMVMDRNEELILINGKYMSELQEQNQQVKNMVLDNKTVLGEHQKIIEELKALVSETKDTLKQMKIEWSNMRTSFMPPAVTQMSPATPLFVPHIQPTPTPRGPFPGFPTQSPLVPVAYGNYTIGASVQAQAAVPPSQFCPSGLPGMKASNVGKYRPHSEDEEEEDLSNVDEASALYQEFLEQEQSYTQYYTPEAQMLQDLSHSVRSGGMEGLPTPTLPAYQPRLSIPAGYFTSALRGQTLQYAASTPASQMKPTTPGPGFFSTPPASVTNIVGVVPSGGVKIQPVLPITAMTPTPGIDNSQSVVTAGSQVTQLKPTGTVKPDSYTSTPATNLGPAAGKLDTSLPASNLAQSATGVQQLFHTRAFLEPKKSKGEITVLVDLAAKKPTVLMLGEMKEIFFHHEITGLKLEPAFGSALVAWSSLKVGSAEQERIAVSFENAVLAGHFKEALLKAVSLVKPQSVSAEAKTEAGSVRLFGSTATSGPVTSSTTPKTCLFGDNKGAGQFSFGGLTFSSAPTVEPVTDKAKAKVEAPKQLPVVSKTEPVKPFAGFSLTTATSNTTVKPEVRSPSQETVKPAAAGLGKSPVAQGSPFSGLVKIPGGGREEDHVDEYEPTAEFKPVISLPELVDKKTGEENETEVYVGRCQLFRFDADARQWKERGVGDLKILRSKHQLKFRIIMRREQILKLCANHFLTPDMKLTPMSKSDRAWCYFASDFSEELIKHEQLAVKFKNADLAAVFKEKFEECIQILRQADVDKDDDNTETQKPVVAVTKYQAQAKPAPTTSQSLSDMFKPKPGTWECEGCLVRNTSESKQCVACGKTKPSSTQSETQSLGDMFKPKTGSWECELCLVRNTPEYSQCVACGNPKPGPIKQESQSLSQMFKPKTGSWECDKCLVRNEANLVTCAACQAQKPGTTASVVSKDTPPGSGLLFGALNSGSAGTGFKFGQASSTVLPTTGGFAFKSTTAATTASTFTFGTSSAVTATTSLPSAGFVFKAPGVPTAPVTQPTPVSTPLSGFTFKTPTQTPATSTSTSPIAGFAFKPQTLSAPPSANPTMTASPASVFNASAFGAKPGFTIGASTPLSAPSSVGSGTSSTTSTTTSVTTATTTSAGFNFAATGFKFQPAGQTGPSQPASGGMLAKLLTSDDSVVEEPVKPRPSAPGFNFSMTPKPSGSFSCGETTTSSRSSSGFQFSFTRSPPKPQKGSAAPQSPEGDEHDASVEAEDSQIHFEPVVSLPDNFEVKTGEEDEDILFESRAKLYRFLSGEWKEKGVGVVKILRHKETKKTRVLMRRDQVLKICCNHIIEPALNLQTMSKSEGKAWVWYALDFAEDEGGKMEQLAIRFREVETAANFKEMFDQCRNNVQSASSIERKSPVPGEDVGIAETGARTGYEAGDDDDDVVFIREDLPTESQVSRSRQYLLPDSFYLYELKPPCPGCIGCYDGELPPSATITPSQESTLAPAQTIQENLKSKDKTPDVPVFGLSANLPDFASLTSDAPAEGEFVFGSRTTMDFSSLAATSGHKSEYSWGKSSTAAPFKFAGAGQRLFGCGSTGGADAGEDEDGEEGGADEGDGNRDIHFEPVIPLPELVKVTTGEEDWTALFCQRSKVYKYDRQTAQWKERGIGEIKIMTHNTKNMFRILQRREQILKVSCNHLLTLDMELKPLMSSETAWCWVAHDLSESEPSVEQFAAKFKNKEIAIEFKKVFDECQEKLQLNTVQTESQQGQNVQAPSASTLTHQQLSQPSQSQPQPPQPSMSLPLQSTQQLPGSSLFQQIPSEHQLYQNQSASSQPTPSPLLFQQLTQNPSYSEHQQQFSFSSYQAQGETGDYEENEGVDEEEDDDEEDDDNAEYLILDKRATLSSLENGAWKKQGVGSLRVSYDDDTSGFMVTFQGDDNVLKCRHIICRENKITQNEKNCEWRPLNFVTDEPVRSHFMASFSSTAAAEEFAGTFRQGQKTARESEISEVVTSVMDTPVIFSSGESGTKG